MAELPGGLESFSEGTRLRALRTAFEDPRWALTGIGAMLVGRSSRAFQEGRMGSVHWKDRGETDMVPNWPGVLADLEHGTTPKRHRFDARPVLRDTGRLKGSIAFRLIADHTVEVGTRLPYAGVLHAGGESKSVRITAAIQERLWKWIQKARARMKSAPKRLEKARQSGDEEKAARAVKTTDRDIVQGSMAEKLTWLLNKKFTDDQLTIKHPARPIVGLPDDLVRDIEQRYGHKIGQV